MPVILLSEALDIELLALRESLLYIFAMIYNNEEIEKSTESR